MGQRAKLNDRRPGWKKAAYFLLGESVAASISARVAFRSVSTAKQVSVSSLPPADPFQEPSGRCASIRADDILGNQVAPTAPAWSTPVRIAARSSAYM